MSFIGTGIVGAALMVVSLLQKNHTYTVIQYTDAFDEKQMLIFDFKGKLKEAQQMIYNRMVASHFSKKKLLESQKKGEDDLKAQRFSLEEKISTDNSSHTNEAKPENKTTIVQQISEDNNTSSLRLAKTKNYDDNPLRIPQIRFAKGEISNEEYEEMRKMIES